MPPDMAAKRKAGMPRVSGLGRGCAADLRVGQPVTPNSSLRWCMWYLKPDDHSIHGWRKGAGGA